MAAVLVWWAWKHERGRGHTQSLPTGRDCGRRSSAASSSWDGLAAHQIVLNSASLTYMVPLGVSAPAAISVGHAVGAGNRALARRNGSMAIACLRQSLSALRRSVPFVSPTDGDGCPVTFRVLRAQENVAFLSMQSICCIQPAELL
jgi:MatE